MWCVTIEDVFGPDRHGNPLWFLSEDEAKWYAQCREREGVQLGCIVKVWRAYRCLDCDDPAVSLLCPACYGQREGGVA